VARNPRVDVDVKVPGDHAVRVALRSKLHLEVEVGIAQGVGGRDRALDGRAAGNGSDTHVAPGVTTAGACTSDGPPTAATE